MDRKKRETERVERSKARTVFQICGNWRMEREKGKSLVQLVATGERCMKKRIEGGFVCFEVIFYYHTTRTVYGDLDLFSDI
jgi:hypothetical protein